MPVPIRISADESRMMPVTAQAKHIIEDFGSLPDQEKREVLAELIRMARRLD